MKTRQIRLAARPVGEPQDSDFEVTEEELPALEDGQVLVRALYLSLDPYMRGRMSEAKSYADPVPLGGVMVGATICEVVESRAANRTAGDLVLAYTGWQTHAVVPARAMRRITPGDLPPSAYLGVLGMPGFTAYAGLLEIGQPQAGETLVVAAATGPVGSAVGQIAKLKGLRTVGIAGGSAKCAALTESLGFDVALDHRSPDFADQLAAAVPDGIDIYFENVSGHVAAAVYPLLNTYARVPVCGLIADYNGTGAPEGHDRLPALMRLVLSRSLRIRGFIQDEFVPTHTEAFNRDMAAWVADGSVRYLEDVVDGLENAPEAFRGLLAGRNFGKLVIKVAD